MAWKQVNFWTPLKIVILSRYDAAGSPIVKKEYVVIIHHLVQQHKSILTLKSGAEKALIETCKKKYEKILISVKWLLMM